MMRGLFGVLLASAATALLEGPASAHHSQSMFDTSREVLFQGTVVRFDWVNPHMYLIIETTGPDGKPVRVEGEGLAITQARADGLKREALRPGTRVVMRANPNRGGPGKQVRILDVTTQDGEIHPFYAASTRDRTLKPANSLAGRWAPSRQALGAAFGAMAGWPVTPAGRAAQKNLAADGLCYVEPIPFLAMLDEMRAIEMGKDEVVMRFDNSGDIVVRRVRMNAAHPAKVQPSRQGHSIGRWEGDTLVIDTIGFEPDPSGLGMNVPSSTRKHTIERLTLTEARTRLRYEITVEDPAYLTKPATLVQQWDHRPDLGFSPASEACDDEVAARYRDSLPKK
jgi:hypothetical protein